MEIIIGLVIFASKCHPFIHASVNSAGGCRQKGLTQVAPYQMLLSYSVAKRYRWQRYTPLTQLSIQSGLNEFKL